MTTTIPCRAKDPRTCPYHGAEIRVQEALDAGDYNAYRKAQEELLAATETVPEVFAFFKASLSSTNLTPAERTAREEAGDVASQVLVEAMELAEKRNPRASRRDRAALFARVPNEVVGEVALGFLKGNPGNLAAISDAENIFMYRVIAGDPATWQPTPTLAHQIVDSGDERAKLLFASHMPLNAKSVQGGNFALLEKLGTDKNPEIREYIARTPDIYRYDPSATNPLSRRLREDGSRDVRNALVNNERLTLEDAEALEMDDDMEIAGTANERASEMRAANEQREELQAAARRDYEAREAAGTLKYWERDDFEENYGDDA